MTEHTTSYYAASANKYEPFPTLDAALFVTAEGDGHITIVIVVDEDRTGLQAAAHAVAISRCTRWKNSPN
jgi:hypothetical protein